MPAQRQIHFVGSIGLPDTETVLRTLADKVGERASAYPDGETGVRTNWVNWQDAVFAAHPAFEMLAAAETPNLPNRWKIRDEMKGEPIQFDSIGYAEEAMKSWEVFRQLRDDGVIPPSVRFQVSLPTPFAVFMRSDPADIPVVEPAYTAAMARDVAQICDAIPHDSLTLQWDVAAEVIGYDGALPVPMPREFFLDHTVNTIASLSEQIPEAVSLGIHLCYGDPGHKHIVEPEDMATLVRFANALVASCPHTLDFVHVPVPRDRDDDSYFAPLCDLDIGDCRLIMGLVHLTDGVEGTRRRMATADRHLPDYDIATECGFGRRPADTIPDLLDVHLAVL